MSRVIGGCFDFFFSVAVSVAAYHILLLNFHAFTPKGINSVVYFTFLVSSKTGECLNLIFFPKKKEGEDFPFLQAW